MTYKLEFKESAKKEFDKLGPDIKDKFRKKLANVLENPRIAKNKLRGSGSKDLYKIKLRSDGYRLLYQVFDDEIVIIVITVGKRDNVYSNL
ncbi:type II toxin-antitoxin system RelE/ParE family toxin [Moraxella sp. ZJ142]|uniref:type II toxin-antitoxin system RelE family toxin n=1 Tax=Moraxella marmotae TaxID=3344520 RepID=UPI0035D4AB3B